jgi:hypothetical protein
MTHLRLLIPVVIWSLVAAIGPTLYATEGTTTVKGPPPDVLTEVSISAYVIDLLSIHGADQAFSADISTHVSWRDARLAHKSATARIAPLDSIWTPQIIIANIRSSAPSLPETVEIQPDGTVDYHQRLTGTFTSHFNLKKFPNDQQTLNIQFIARGHGMSEVTLIQDLQRTGRAERLTLSDWAVGEVELSEAPYVIPSMDIEIPGLRMEIPVKRYVGYYAGSILASASIIICMAWLVFWIPPVAINPRISVSVTSMLTLIAHRFVIQGELPNLPYLTTMDYFLLGSTLMVLLGLIEVVIVFRAHNRGNEDSARRLNRFFRWTYPLPFLALLAFVLFQ